MSEVSRSSAVFYFLLEGAESPANISAVICHIGSAETLRIIHKATNRNSCVPPTHNLSLPFMFPCCQLLDKFDSLIFCFTVLRPVCVAWWNVSWYKQSTKMWNFSILHANFFLESSVFLNACGPLVR